MLKSYIKIAFRNLRNNKFYTGLNIIGLAAGLATCILILLYIMDELSFDRYNVNAKNIYRINNEIKFGDNQFDVAQSPALMGAELVKELPQVIQYTRLRWHGSLLVKKGTENLSENSVGYGDSTLFEVFTLPMLAGDPKTALKAPHSLVLTESIAKKYFNTTDAVGRTMVINDTSNYTVTAVIKDIPKQSHFHFDIFVPFAESEDSRSDNWLSSNFNTYILVKENTDPVQLKRQVQEMMNRFIGPELKSVLGITLDEFTAGGSYSRYSPVPLTSIHLYSNKEGELDGNGNIQYVYIFSAIALFILLIACVNFMNLSTARSASRAKEVGVRKVLGSLRANLIKQFITESLLVSFIALVLAILIAWALLPYFNQLAGKGIRVGSIFQPRMLLSLVILMVIVGLLAGSYPAFFLSAFQPIEVLKGKLARGFKGASLRNALVVFQFSISIMLIIGTAVIYNQLMYIHHKDIGYNRNQVLIIKNTSVLGDQAEAFKNDLLQINGIENATLTGYLPVNYYRSNDVFFPTTSLDQKTAISMQEWEVDEHYIPTLDLKLVQGRNFSKQFSMDADGIILNEAAAKFLGAKDILNKKLYEIKDLKTKELREFHVIGVVKNFNFSSLRDVITPLALIPGRETANLSVRLKTGDLPNIMAQLKNKWQVFVPGKPFDYSFMDEDFEKIYDTEQRTGKICISFAVLAILIACLGLFGLISFAAEQRAKEIGIRKVLGASVANIARMLSTSFLKLVVIAAVIAFPLAWWVMSKWLQTFAYRTNISWWIFVVAGVLALIIALLTVSFQAIKAAVANPVKSLKTE